MATKRDGGEDHEATISRGQRVADETVHHLRPDGRVAVSFRVPLEGPPPVQMTTGVAARERAKGKLAPVDVGQLADGPSVWEALPDEPEATPPPRPPPA